jgi:hypothetical protein
VTEADWSENTLVTISLVDSSGKAVFGYSLLDSTSTSGVVTNAILDVVDADYDNTGAVDLALRFQGNLVVSSGGIGETSIGFTVQPSGADQLDEGSTLDFYFCIDKADVLKTAGQSIGVSVEAGGATSTLSTVITAKSGAKMDITAGADKDLVEVDVGGEAGAKKFIGSSIDETTAILGEICLESAGAIYDDDLIDPWSPFASGNADSITFTITNAPFSASISHEVPTDDDSNNSYNEDQINKVMVFLDLDRNDKFSEAVVDGTLATGGDIPATTVTTTTATFEITDDDLPYLTALMGRDNGDYGFQHADADEGCVNVIFKVSGDTVIETFDTPPVGEMVIDFSTSASITDNLNHIKKSGTFCTLYNVPGPNSIENANVRVINKSGDEGTLFGTLRLPDGTEPFSNVSLGVIAPNATFYISTEGLETIAKNNGWDEGWSRAILELESNLDEVEMMALVRDDDVMGAPLMNMSVGATGNGCGR